MKIYPENKEAKKILRVSKQVKIVIQGYKFKPIFDTHCGKKAIN